MRMICLAYSESHSAQYNIGRCIDRTVVSVADPQFSLLSVCLWVLVTSDVWYGW